MQNGLIKTLHLMKSLANVTGIEKHIAQRSKDQTNTTELVDA
jgi:hypothetical protein